MRGEGDAELADEPVEEPAGALVAAGEAQPADPAEVDDDRDAPGRDGRGPTGRTPGGARLDVAEAQAHGGARRGPQAGEPLFGAAEDHVRVGVRGVPPSLLLGQRGVQRPAGGRDGPVVLGHGVTALPPSRHPVTHARCRGP